MQHEVDFNLIIQNQLTALLNAQGVSNELKMVDEGYQISILIEQVEDDE